VRLLGDDTLAMVDEVFAAGARHAVLLMRHSAREFVPGRHDLLNPLTDEGRALAERFGRALGKSLIVRGYSSPAERCVETAQLVLKGHEGGGGAVTRHRPVEGLGVFYVLDQMKMFRTMHAAEGQVPFLESWYAGRVPVDVMIPAAAAARLVIGVLHEKLRQPVGSPQLDVCVSHDMTVYLMRDRLLGEQAAEHGEVRFLDGLMLYQDARGETWLRSARGSSARVEPG